MPERPGDAEHQDDRDDDDDRRQHARRQDDEEVGVVALQRIAREAVGGERADDKREEHRDAGDEDRVEEEEVEAGVLRLRRPAVMARENTEPKFSSVGVKTNWSGMRPKNEVGDKVGGTDSASPAA